MVGQDNHADPTGGPQYTLRTTCGCRTKGYGDDDFATCKHGVRRVVQWVRNGQVPSELAERAAVKAAREKKMIDPPF